VNSFKLLELSDFYYLAQGLKPEERRYSVFLLGGSEEFLKKELFRLLKKKLQPEPLEFNSTYFSLHKIIFSDWETELKAYPILSSFRLSILEIDEKASSQQVEQFFKRLESLELYDTYLVVLFNREDFKKQITVCLHASSSDKKNFVGEEQEKPQYDIVAVDCRPPYSYQVGGWIQQIANRYQLKFRQEALILFHTRVGDTLSHIDLEIQKLQHFSDQGWITEQVVSDFVVFHHEAKVFEAIKKFFNGDFLGVHHDFETLLFSGESPTLLVVLLLRQTRLLLKLHLGRKMGFQGAKLAQYLKVPQYFLKSYESQAVRWSEKSLEFFLVQLSHLDWDLKTKNMDSSQQLLNWIIEPLRSSVEVR
jgi:DNA polymerase III delta subunit